MPQLPNAQANPADGLEAHQLLFNRCAYSTSRMVTRSYSTSFSRGIHMLHRRNHDPIYAIYGFVRYADEIVDTFHDYDKENLLQEFWDETFRSITRGISVNPILHAFQDTVRRYDLPHHLIEAFLKSMAMDLKRSQYDASLYEEYIYGSAEVVGLMCLKVFCHSQPELYDQLVPAAQSLGAAFQKVNFLRDIRSDYTDRGRVYFPGVDFCRFDEACKRQIEQEIEADFAHAYTGIVRLPRGARLGVYVAYRYYMRLFARIRRMPAQQVLQRRVRVPNAQKLTVLVAALVRHRFIPTGI